MPNECAHLVSVFKVCICVCVRLVPGGLCVRLHFGLCTGVSVGVSVSGSPSVSVSVGFSVAVSVNVSLRCRSYVK